jgi:hypothetical protein
MDRNQKKKLINGASSLLKSLVKGAASKKKSTSGSVAPPAPAKAPCGACGGKK